MTLHMNTRQLFRFAIRLGFVIKIDVEWDELIAWPVAKPKQTIHVEYRALYFSKQEKQEAIQEMVATLSFGKDKEPVEKALQFAMQKK